MREIFKYEYNKVKISLKYMSIIIILSQILPMIFFTFVGIFETKDTSSILQNARGISILSTLFNISIISIYLTLFSNKFLLEKYIKNVKERMYMFPNSKEIFAEKLKAIILRYSLLFLPVVSIINFLFYIVMYFFYNFKLISPFISAISTSLFSFFISIFILIISLIFGLKFESKNSSLISSVIIVAIMGNIIATSFFITSFYTLLVSLVLMIIDYITYKYIIKIVNYS